MSKKTTTTQKNTSTKTAATSKVSAPAKKAAKTTAPVASASAEDETQQVEEVERTEVAEQAETALDATEQIEETAVADAVEGVSPFESGTTAGNEVEVSDNPIESTVETVTETESAGNNETAIIADTPQVASNTVATPVDKTTTVKVSKVLGDRLGLKGYYTETIALTHPVEILGKTAEKVIFANCPAGDRVFLHIQLIDANKTRSICSSKSKVPSEEWTRLSANLSGQNITWRDKELKKRTPRTRTPKATPIPVITPIPQSAVAGAAA